MDARVVDDKPLAAERPSDSAAETRATVVDLRPVDERPRWQRMHRRRLLAAAIALFVLLAAGGGWWYLKPSAEVAYVSAEVSRGAVAPYVTASGTVNPVVTVQVGTYVSGVIQELYCDFNTQVKAGQLCARIDPRPYQVVVDQDTAALAAAQAQVVRGPVPHCSWSALWDGSATPRHSSRAVNSSASRSPARSSTRRRSFSRMSRLAISIRATPTKSWRRSCGSIGSRG